MDKKLNISKVFVLRLSFLLVLLASAMVFDMYHENMSDEFPQAQKNTTSPIVDVAQAFYFNTGNSFKVVNGADKLLSRILFSANSDKLLSRFHNNRTFHSLKEESLKDRLPFHLMAHFIKFTSIQYSSPDDYHSIS